jgi:hypothetical protein
VGRELSAGHDIQRIGFFDDVPRRCSLLLQTPVGGILQYFRTSGSQDMLLYNTGDVVMGSFNGSPDSNGWVAEANYLPADRIKLAVRYTAFQTYNGASTNYMPGRSASDNNNVFVLAWILF